MSAELVTGAVGVILGGGGVGTFTSFYVAKKRTPAEVRDITLTGSETAVMTLTKAVDVVTQQRDDERADNARLRAENEQLHAMIADLRKEAETLAGQVAGFQAKIAAYEAELGPA